MLAPIEGAPNRGGALCHFRTSIDPSPNPLGSFGGVKNR
jgi:hypothetical protein